MARGVMLKASVFRVKESSARAIWNKGGTALSRPFFRATFLFIWRKKK